MTLRLTILSAILFLTTQTAFAAYFKIPINTAVIDPNRRTHFVISGAGNELRSAPLVAASAKARQIAGVVMSDQVVLIATGQDKSFLRKLGYNNEILNERLLDSRQLMNELDTFSQIASLHFYGHGSIKDGVFLDRKDSTDQRWRPHDPESVRQRMPL